MKGLLFSCTSYKCSFNIETGYLRMATKLLTAIGEAIEGKTISVTICHDCHEVSKSLFL